MDRQLKKLVARTVVVCLALAAGISAYRYFEIGGTSWCEQILLHDGNKLIVKRHIDRGGRHEIGQRPPVAAEILEFDLPSTNERVTWKRDANPTVGYADLKPIVLDIVQGVPYLVTTPVGCLAYNVRGRPNPPYMIYKFVGGAWQSAGLGELPKVIEVPNLIISSPDVAARQSGKNPIPAADIARLNVPLTQPQYSSIRREALPEAQICPPELTGFKAPIPIPPRVPEKSP